MAAETACAAGVAVDVYESKGSVGRKFLLAGKGGLNLTHSEDLARFIERYGSRREEISRWLADFGPDEVRQWARGLNVETFVGTSGRVFPADLKAAPLLRGWVHRLRSQGVRFHVNHYCDGLSDYGRTLRLRTAQGQRDVHADAVVLCMGGGSWPELGSDGRWVAWLQDVGMGVAPLRPSNCGFDIGWSDVFAQRFAGQPVKSVLVSMHGGQGRTQLQGEFVITRTGIEGSVIYALSAQLREAIDADGLVTVELDLAPGRDQERLQQELAQPRRGRSLTEHLRRRVGIDGVKAGLLYEVVPRSDMEDPVKLAAAIKSLPLRLVRARPIAEAISSAGGVRFNDLDDTLMLKSLPGVFCAGEMIDWEAPTGGYLLTACFASGHRAGRAAAGWLATRSS
jgi:uncharacterized flavoprotein (TIGR03862 family)